MQLREKPANNLYIRKSLVKSLIMIGLRRISLTRYRLLRRGLTRTTQCSNNRRAERILAVNVQDLHVNRSTTFQSWKKNHSRESYSTSSFSIQEILPPQDAFAQRHLGPRKDETKEMLQFLNLKVREGLKISLVVAC